MIDEASRRRETFSPVSVPITLGDGQQWHVPKPWCQMRPKFAKGRPVATLGRSTFGDEFDALMESIDACEDDYERIKLILYVAAFMLCLNYDLADDELEELLVFHLGSDDDKRWLVEVLAVATGRDAPKARPGGSVSP